jgi:hypothetical protein
MPVFTVHMPFSGDRAEASAEKALFVRDGFQFWAFVFGPLWFAWHRLWIAAVAYLMILAGLEAAMSWLRLDVGARLLVMWLIGLLIGFEAASIFRLSRSRGRWREVGLVVADNREGAERRFFSHWTGEAAPANLMSGPPTVPPRPTTGSNMAGTHTAGAHDVIGLFPQPGGQR